MIRMSQLVQATLGGGCFWCTEAVFQNLKGVMKVESGYAGGHVKNPTYREVCSKTTGHAEVIQITFDPDVISYEQLLEVFWTTHDPTTKDQQGNDRGPQYRSIILYHDEAQKVTAEKSVKEVATSIWSDPIVTEIEPYSVFYKAESEHQNFYNLHGGYHGYCRVVISPKVSKVRNKFAHLLKPQEG